MRALGHITLDYLEEVIVEHELKQYKRMFSPDGDFNDILDEEDRAENWERFEPIINTWENEKLDDLSMDDIAYFTILLNDMYESYVEDSEKAIDYMTALGNTALLAVIHSMTERLGRRYDQLTESQVADDSKVRD